MFRLCTRCLDSALESTKAVAVKPGEVMRSGQSLWETGTGSSEVLHAVRVVRAKYSTGSST